MVNLVKELSFREATFRYTKSHFEFRAKHHLRRFCGRFEILQCVRNFVRMENYHYICSEILLVMPISFSLDKRENYAHECAIRVSWTWRVCRYQTTIGQRIKPSDWDKLRRRVNDGAHNNNGVPADAINAILKKLFSMVYAMEKIAHTNSILIQPFMMKGAIKDVLTNTLTYPDDIASKWLYASEYSERDRVEYYKDEKGRFYKGICTANYVQYGFQVRIIKELFGEENVLAEPLNEFDRTSADGKVWYCKYCKTTEDEAFGRVQSDQ